MKKQIVLLVFALLLSPLAFAAETDAAGAGCAEDYLSGLGLTADKVACLRQKLSQDYGGLSE